MDEHFLAHYVAGQWCAPLSQRLHPVSGRAQVVLAGPADIARAIARTQEAPAAEDYHLRAATVLAQMLPVNGNPPYVIHHCDHVEIRLTAPAPALADAFSRGRAFLLLAAPALAPRMVPVVQALDAAGLGRPLALLYV